MTNRPALIVAGLVAGLTVLEPVTRTLARAMVFAWITLGVTP